MLQFSVYARVNRGEEAVDKHLARIVKRLPPKGNVRTLSVTERQYARMKLLIGESETVAPNSWSCSEFRRRSGGLFVIIIDAYAGPSLPRGNR
jgi:CRISPR/Cas system-associated protein endoribonuclease Cas2